MKKGIHIKVRELRKQKGITQTHMSKKLGYKSVSSYNAFESGRMKRGLGVEQARIIARELGLTLDELFFENDLRETRNDEEDDTDEAHTA
jgi:transcriptional regulator with XRE-family HTH domain